MRIAVVGSHDYPNPARVRSYVEHDTAYNDRIVAYHHSIRERNAVYDAAIAAACDFGRLATFYGTPDAIAAFCDRIVLFRSRRDCQIANEIIIHARMRSAPITVYGPDGKPE